MLILRHGKFSNETAVLVSPAAVLCSRVFFSMMRGVHEPFEA
jgi:hypothetical protein